MWGGLLGVSYTLGTVCIFKNLNLKFLNKRLASQRKTPTLSRQWVSRALGSSLRVRCYSTFNKNKKLLRKSQAYGGIGITKTLAYFKGEELKYILLILISISFIIYIFYGNLFIFSLSFYFTLVILQMVNNNYKFSDYFIIRISQKFVIYIIIGIIVLYISIIIMDKIDLIGDIYCQGDDILSNIDNSNISNTSNNTNDTNKDSITLKKDEVVITSKEALNEIANNIANVGKDLIKETFPGIVEGLATAAGAGSAAAATVNQIFNNTAGQPILRRTVMAATGAAFVGGAVSTSLRTSAAMSRQQSITKLENISPSLPRAELDCVAPPSPKEEFIHSVIEPSELMSPLVELINCQFIFSSIMVLSIIMMVFICISWYINKYNISFLKQILGDKLGGFLKFTKYTRNMSNFNNKFYISLLIINILVLIFCILMQLYISNELVMNIDDYIAVHNYIKNPPPTPLLK